MSNVKQDTKLTCGSVTELFWCVRNGHPCFERLQGGKVNAVGFQRNPPPITGFLIITISFHFTRAFWNLMGWKSPHSISMRMRGLGVGVVSSLPALSTVQPRSAGGVGNLGDGDVSEPRADPHRMFLCESLKIARRTHSGYWGNLRADPWSLLLSRLCAV